MHNGRSTGRTHTGYVRPENQDAILLDEKLRLWIVADGMGGRAGGAEASQLAVTTVRAGVAVGQALPEAIVRAHNAISDRQAAKPEFSEMGTTIVAVLERDGQYEIAWVGDSRAYLFDRSMASLRLLTRDHNLAGHLVEAGTISASEAARHPKRHVLTECLGMTSREVPRVDGSVGDWRPNQELLLCSDGLNSELAEQALAQALIEQHSIDKAADRLMDEVLLADARDNISLILIASPLSSSGRS